MPKKPAAKGKSRTKKKSHQVLNRFYKLGPGNHRSILKTEDELREERILDEFIANAGDQRNDDDKCKMVIQEEGQEIEIDYNNGTKIKVD